jgi:hypothetical protein
LRELGILYFIKNFLIVLFTYAILFHGVITHAC